MKKLFIFTFLAMAAALSGHAALFVNNNTNCTVVFQVYAHDFNHGTCGLVSGRVVLGPMQSTSFNNVTNLNTTPGWLNGQTAVTTGGTAAWGWDGTAFNGSLGGQLGNTTACFSTNTLTVPNNGCLPVAPVTANWSSLGATNTLLEFVP